MININLKNKRLWICVDQTLLRRINVKSTSIRGVWQIITTHPFEKYSEKTLVAFYAFVVIDYTHIYLK